MRTRVYGVRFDAPMLTGGNIREYPKGGVRCCYSGSDKRLVREVELATLLNKPRRTCVVGVEPQRVVACRKATTKAKAVNGLSRRFTDAGQMSTWSLPREGENL